MIYDRYLTTELISEKTKFEFGTKRHAFAVENLSDLSIYITIKSDGAIGDSGVVEIKAGGSFVLFEENKTDTLYVIGDPGIKISIVSQNSKSNPFKSAAKGGDYAQNLSFAIEFMGIDITPQTDSLSLVRELANITKDMFYFDSAGVIFTYNSRTVTKTYDDPCYAAWFWSVSNWFHPVFIGRTADSVECTMYGSTTGRVNGTLIDDNGETWYYTNCGYGSYQDTRPVENRVYLGVYDDRTEQQEQIASDLLEIVNKWNTYLNI